MTPAAQYLRASTGLQSCSIPEQAAANAAYAALRGFTIVEDYCDEGLSGLTLRGRLALQRLLCDALSPTRRFEAILVYDVSRWGRFQDIDEGAHYEFMCRQAGVAVHYCAEPFENAGSPEANLIKQVKRAMAAEFSRAQSERVTLAKRFIVENGFAASIPPFALTRQIVDRKRRPITVLTRGEVKASSAHRTVFVPGPPDEVATVRKIFRLYAITGLSLKALAECLNQNDAPSPSGRGWSAARLKRTIATEAYAGTYIYGRVNYRLGVGVPAPPESWRRIENAIPAIVPRPLFDRANALLRGRRWRTDAELLQDLCELLDQVGHIDGRVIDAWPYTANSDTYRRRFGGLRAAYRQIGYDPEGVR